MRTGDAHPSKESGRQPGKHPRPTRLAQLLQLRLLPSGIQIHDHQSQAARLRDGDNVPHGVSDHRLGASARCSIEMERNRSTLLRQGVAAAIDDRDGDVIGVEIDADSAVPHRSRIRPLGDRGESLPRAAHPLEGRGDRSVPGDLVGDLLVPIRQARTEQRVFAVLGLARRGKTYRKPEDVLLDMLAEYRPVAALFRALADRAQRVGSGIPPRLEPFVMATEVVDADMMLCVEQLPGAETDRRSGFPRLGEESLRAQGETLVIRPGGVADPVRLPPGGFDIVVLQPKTRRHLAAANVLASGKSRVTLTQRPRADGSRAIERRESGHIPLASLRDRGSPEAEETWLADALLPVDGVGIRSLSFLHVRRVQSDDRRHSARVAIRSCDESTSPPLRLDRSAIPMCRVTDQSRPSRFPPIRVVDPGVQSGDAKSLGYIMGVKSLQTRDIAHIGYTMALEAQRFSSHARARLSAVLRAAKDLVTSDDAVKVLAVDRCAAAKVLARWRRQGWFKRVDPGIYAPVPLDASTTEQVLNDPWILVPGLFAPGYIGGWTAAEYWELTEQLFRSVFVHTARPFRIKERTVQGVSFTLKRIQEDAFFGIKILWRGQTRVSIADKHRTIVDLLAHPATGGGIRHVESCLRKYLRDPEADGDTLIRYAEKLGNGAVFKRLGYLVSQIPGNERLAQSCRQRLTEGNAKLDPALPCRRLVKAWRLWIPKTWVAGAEHDRNY